MKREHDLEIYSTTVGEAAKRTTEPPEAPGIPTASVDLETGPKAQLSEKTAIVTACAVDKRRNACAR
jgi:hypothetical protein